MQWRSGLLGLAFAVMLGSARADTPRISPLYLTNVEAELSLADDGSVRSVHLPRTPALEGEIGDRLEARMRHWRFEVDAGAGGEKPTRVHVQMMLEAREIDATEWQVRLSTPVLSTRRIGERLADEDYQVDGQHIKRVPVKWPASGVQVGARIEVLVEFDAGGRVIRSGARRAQLLGVTVEPHQTARAENALQPFVREAERSLARWRFPAAAESTETRSVLVPVHFQPAGRHGPLDKWELAVAVHALERDWTQPDPDTNEPAPPALADDDLSFGLVRLAESVDGQLL